MQRESRLPRPAGAREREEAGVVAHEQLPDIGKLVLAAEEGRRGYREVRAVERLQRREVAVAQLEDPLRRAQVLEPVLAELAELSTVDECRSRRRDEHLPAVPAAAMRAARWTSAPT